MTESCSNTTSGEWKLPKNMTAEKREKRVSCDMLVTSVIHIIGFKMSVSDDGAEGYSIWNIWCLMVRQQ